MVVKIPRILGKILHHYKLSKMIMNCDYQGYNFLSSNIASIYWFATLEAKLIIIIKQMTRKGQENVCNDVLKFIENNHCCLYYFLVSNEKYMKLNKSLCFNLNQLISRIFYTQFKSQFKSQLKMYLVLRKTIIIIIIYLLMNRIFHDI
jgi:hypothetical protein